ncbi:nitrogenase-stabilizing/protective protein NifW [Methylibium sp.]|uniref:nitrogenase-stabilizing/protective protein NifW n=1 Tax=Methylibium sp. TaxID=2067992 RepID=UPI003D09F593
MNELAQRLRELSSAEDFLDFFAVPYDTHVVDTRRPHLLKRFFQYIRQEPELPADNEQALYRCYRALLIRSYGDFLAAPMPARERVFRNADAHVPRRSLSPTLPSATHKLVSREPA